MTSQYSQLQELFSENRDGQANSRNGFAALSEACKSGDFVLYGAGQTGKWVAESLAKANVKPKAFMDDTPSKKGQTTNGLVIHSADETDKDTTVVITIFYPSVSFLSIKKKLNGQGFKKVYSFIHLFSQYPHAFLPYYQFDFPEAIAGHKQKVLEAFNLFEDETSQQVFLSNLRLRLNFDFENLVEADYDYYFPSEIFTELNTGPVTFVDCGAFDGDSIKKFLAKNIAKPVRIIGFEPDSDNFKKLTDYVVSLPQNVSDSIHLFNLGISNSHSFKRFNSSNSMGSALSDSGNTVIQTVQLDDFLYAWLKESGTRAYIKMDVEGAEPKALEGLQKVMAELKPCLAISAYHHPADLWVLTDLIKNSNPAYQFFLRQHGADGMDLVLYAK